MLRPFQDLTKPVPGADPRTYGPIVRPDPKLVFVGIEVEAKSVIIGAPYAGEILQDSHKRLTTIDRRVNLGVHNGDHITLVEEVDLSTIELNLPPLEPHDVWDFLAKMAVRLRGLSKGTIAFAPISNAPLRPMGENGVREYKLNTHYKANYTRLQPTAEDQQNLSTCAFHVHVSLGGKLSDDEALLLTEKFRAFLPWLMALSAASPIHQGNMPSPDPKAENFSSTRWLRMSSLRNHFFEHLGLNRMEHGAAAIRFGRDSGLGVPHGEDELNNAAQRMWGPVRPNFKHGTVEIRIFDSPKSITEMRLFAQLTAGLAQMLDDMSLEEIRALSATDLKDELMDAAQWGMYENGAHMINPFARDRNKRLTAAELNGTIVSRLRPYLETQGTYQEVLDGFRGLRDFGTGAAREFREAVMVHEIFHRAGVPGSELPLDRLMTGTGGLDDNQFQLSELEMRVIQLAQANGWDCELTREGQQRREQILRNAMEVVAGEYGLDVRDALRVEAPVHDDGSPSMNFASDSVDLGINFSLN